MKRTHYSKDISPAMNGKKVKVAGWISNIRKLGSIAFIKLRDREGFVQITLHKKSAGDMFSALDEFTLESVISVFGEVKANPQAPNGFEIIPEKLELLSKAERPLPMDISGKIESELETRLNARFMDLRQPRIEAIFMIRDGILTAIRGYLENKGFIEIHTPKIVAAGAEGGATLFPVKYFDKDAYLNQSPQLFKQIMMSTGLDKVYEIAPAFRAEPSATTRHLSEFTSFDFEMAFIDSQEEVMEILEECIVHALKHVKKHEKNFLEVLGVDLKIPHTPFKRVKFEEVKEMLKLRGKAIDRDLDTESEKALNEIIEEDFYFITDFPSETKPFYIMENDENAEISCSFDLDYKGLELASGGQREHRYDKLVERIKKLGLNPNNFSFYLNAFKYGMPPHGGMGLGIERLIQKMLNLANVRETVLFPRDKIRLVP